MLRVGLAQVNATVGDLAGNSEIIVEWTRRAAARGARVVVFPEMALTGYPVEDLALRTSFVEASITTVRDVAERLNVEGLGGGAGGVGDLGRGGGGGRRVPGPAGRPRAADRAPGRGAAGRGGGAARRARGDHQRQAPPAELRRLRRVPVLRARRYAAGLPGSGRGRRVG